MGNFLAHMHPALVHLPIGFILLALLIEWHQKNNNSVSKDKLTIFLWGMSALVSLMAMGTGLLSLKTGYYEGLNMFIHLLCGYSIAIFTTLVWFTKWKEKSYFKHQNTVLKTAVVGCLLVGGHFGGELTHGEEYLPLPFTDKGGAEKLDLSDRDSIDIYGDVIADVFNKKCNRCHEEGDARGRLNMTHQEGLLSDKFGDPAIAPNDLANSEVYKRITRSPWDAKYMPPSGPPITYKEKKLIEWWIMAGAPFGENLRKMELDKEMKEFFAKEYGIDLRVKSFYEKAKIDPLATDVFDNIKAQKFNVTNLAANNNFIDITNHGQSKEMNAERVGTFLGAKEHITWLDLSSTELDDEGMKTIGQLVNLTKLNINNTKITDTGLDNIKDLEQLTTLNLYGTAITDAGLDKLTGLKKLKSLYLWQTQTTEEGIEKIKSALANCEVVTGVN